MFKKQSNVKSTSSIRNSERKNLVTQVKNAFPLALQDKSAEEAKELLDLILPASGINATPFTTTKGVRGVLYSFHNSPIFVHFEQYLVPTIQTIWKCPDLVTTVLTGSQVLKNLQAGSDLMLKGMFEYSSQVKAGEVVGIRITGRQHIIAVGLAALDFSRVDREEGGKGILLVSCLGDTISPWEAYPAETLLESTELDTLQDLSLQSSDRQTQIETEAGTRTEESEEAEEAEGQPPLHISLIDEAFSQSLLYGLYLLTSTNSESSLQLPVNASTMMDTYVLPYLPSSHPDLTMKKSSWKKANKFITKQKILKCKESKGQVTVTAIDWSHPELQSFVPYRLPSSDNSSDKKPDRETTDEGHAERKMDVEDLYRVPSALYPLFVEEIEKDYLTQADLREALSKYCTKEDLVTRNPKMIKLDPQLFHLLAPKTSQQEVSREVLLRYLMAKCTKYYRLNSEKVKKGSPPTIQIIIEQRAGRKSVSRITQLDKYFSPAELDDICDALKKRCAVSVSIGSAKIGTGSEVSVQGKKALDITEILIQWGIKKNWLVVEDRSK